MLSNIALLDERGASPLYMQLQQALRDLVVTEKLRASESLPPERDIAKALGISRITVRKALDGLEQEGLIQRRRGSGTFVTDRVQHDFSALSSFTADLIARGSAPRTQWIDRLADKANADDTFSFGFPPGIDVYRLNRIRFADDEPVLVEYTVVPAECLASVDAVEDSLYEAMAAVGVRPARALQRLRAIQFDENHAGMLGIEVGAPGLLVERRSFDTAGRAIEVTKSWCRGDSYHFVSELNIPS